MRTSAQDRVVDKANKSGKTFGRSNSKRPHNTVCITDLDKLNLI